MRGEGWPSFRKQWRQTDEIRSHSDSILPLILQAHSARREWKQAAAFGEGPGARDRSRDCAGLDDGPGLMNRGSETTTPQRSRPQVLSGDRACIAQNTVQNRERREKQLRAALMARRVNRPASTFVLKHLKGTRDDGMDIEPLS